jgi:hypothetical protein
MKPPTTEAMEASFHAIGPQIEVAPKPPQQLDAIVDVVLAYCPKPKSKTAKKRKRRATKMEKARG